MNPAGPSGHIPEAVHLDRDGVTVTDVPADDTGEAVLTAAWPDVVEVAAYVVDVVVEQARVLDLSLANGESIEITSHLAGWDAAVRDLGAHLPLLVPDLATALAELTIDDDVLVVFRRFGHEGE